MGPYHSYVNIVPLLPLTFTKTIPSPAPAQLISVFEKDKEAQYVHEPSSVLALGSKFAALASMQPKIFGIHEPSSIVAFGL